MFESMSIPRSITQHYHKESPCKSPWTPSSFTFCVQAYFTKNRTPFKKFERNKKSQYDQYVQTQTALLFYGRVRTDQACSSMITIPMYRSVKYEVGINPCTLFQQMLHRPQKDCRQKSRQIGLLPLNEKNFVSAKRPYDLVMYSKYRKDRAATKNPLSTCTQGGSGVIASRQKNIPNNTKPGWHRVIT